MVREAVFQQASVRLVYSFAPQDWHEAENAAGISALVRAGAECAGGAQAGNKED